MACEVLTKESCKTGNIIERLLKTLSLNEQNSGNVEKIIISEKYKGEVYVSSMKAPLTFHCDKPGELLMYSMPLKFEDIGDKDFRIILKKEKGK